MAKRTLSRNHEKTVIIEFNKMIQLSSPTLVGVFVCGMMGRFGNEQVYCFTFDYRHCVGTD